MTTEPCAIEFWFEFGSNYSYLSTMRIEDAAREKGVPIIWKAFLLGPIFRALGMENSPFVLQKDKGAYVWRDMERQCRKFGLRWRQPSSFPRVGVLPSRVALFGVAKPLAEFASSGQGRMWIAARDDQVVGSIAIVDAEPGIGRLRWFLLRPEVRGCGLGRRLLEEALGYARQRGFVGLFLWSFSDLTAALSLYRRAGFTTTLTKQSWLWDAERTEVRMDLALRPHANPDSACDFPLLPAGPLPVE